MRCIEVGQDIFKKEDKDKLRKKYEEIFKDAGLPFSTSHLKAFYEGVKLMLHLTKEGEEMSFMAVISLNMLIKEQEGKNVKDMVDKSMEGIGK